MIVSIVIPAHNEEKLIGRCIESILNNTPPELIDIIVVDNASTDKTADIARSHPKVTVLEESKKGTNAARDRGWKAAKGDLVTFIDADATLPKDWFLRMTEEFEKNPKLVAVSGPNYYPDLPFFSRNMLYYIWSLGGVITSLFTGYVVYGGNVMARRSALERMGGFDTSITFYGDDTDMGQRLSAQGPMKFMPSLYIYTSARRLQEEGILKTCMSYGLNFLSTALFKKAATKTHRDIR